MKCMLVTPTYDGTLSLNTHLAIVQALVNSAGKRDIQLTNPNSSLLANCFNQGWVHALNTQPDRFVMLHSDIGPARADWLDRLLHLLDEYELDVLSAVAPIKDARGLTSTAYLEPDGEIVRLRPEDLQEYPPTITAADWRNRTGNILLCNTGLMAVRFDQEWVERFCFNIADDIVRVNGKWEARVMSEDWGMSQWLHAEGIPYGVTREIPLVHIGPKAYESHYSIQTEPDPQTLAARSQV